MKQRLLTCVLIVFILISALGCGNNPIDKDGGNGDEDKKPLRPNTITLSRTELAMTQGDFFDLEISFSYQDEKFEWSVSAAEKVSIVSNGHNRLTINALQVGSVKLTVSADSSSAICNINISPQIPAKELLSETQKTLRLGEDFVLRVAVPQDASFEWSISDPTKLDIVENGQNSLTIMGLSVGNAVVTVQVGTETAVCEITINSKKFNTERLKPHTATLTYYDKGTTSYGITWHAFGENPYPVVKAIEGDYYGQENVNYDIIIRASKDAESNAEKANGERYTEYIFRAVMEGLKPSTTYTYVIGDKVADIWSSQAKITTKSDEIDSFTFINITDTQESAGGKRELADTGVAAFDALTSAFGAYPQSEWILHNGDMVEFSTSEESWQKTLDYNRQFFMSYPTMFVSGNHETTYLSAPRTFYRHFYLDIPDNQAANKTDEEFGAGFYYSFDYGNAHFTILNTNVLTGNALTVKQYNWLRQDLSATAKKWKIVAMHNPIYSPAKWGSAPGRNQIALALREQLMSTFAEFGVDIVIQGHDHVYMDTYPINGKGVVASTTPTKQNGVDYWMNPQGTVFHMAGTAGTNINFKESNADMSYYRHYSQSSKSSYSAFTVEQDRITVKSHHHDNGKNTLYTQYGIIKNK